MRALAFYAFVGHRILVDDSASWNSVSRVLLCSASDFFQRAGRLSHGASLITALVAAVGIANVVSYSNLFQQDLPDIEGKLLVVLGAIVFSTIRAWKYYGEKCFEYLFGEKYIFLYRYAWVIFVFIGA